MPRKSFQVVMRMDVDIEEFDPEAVGEIASDGAPIPDPGLSAGYRV